MRTMTDAKHNVILPSSLEELTICHCGDLELALLGSLQLLTNLSRLELKNCSSLASLPSADVFKCLGSLQEVCIEGCENLSSLGGLGSLASLSKLYIAGCSKLTEAAGSQLLTGVATGSDSGEEEEHLVEHGSSLQITRLNIDRPSLLLVEPLKSLRHTEGLIIGNHSETQSLPERWLLQNSASIQQLWIPEAHSSLPRSMQDLCSLEYLEIFNAGQLQSLAHLPSSLKSLILSGCHPDLVKKVTNHGSPEWNKIAHIPYASIGGGLYFSMGEECSYEAASSVLIQCKTQVS